MPGMKISARFVSPRLLQRSTPKSQAACWRKPESLDSLSATGPVWLWESRSTPPFIPPISRGKASKSAFEFISFAKETQRFAYQDRPLNLRLQHDRRLGLFNAGYLPQLFGQSQQIVGFADPHFQHH